ncbi:MAG TPA: hypothetical protein VK476_00090, partial [Flavobacterium sp.]|nr:hypothetical protein [Flavobacterium sp.]
MAINEENTTNFKFSYDFLKKLAESTLTLIDRDIVEFTDRGFDSIKREEYQQCLTAFAECATDEEMEGIKIAATDAKDEAGTLVEKQMRTI